jgi:dienelactone hydrolase
MKKLILIGLVLFTQPILAICDGVSESFTISDPKDGLPFEVKAKVYLPAGKKFPVIFILPPIVGETILDRRMAEKFCHNKIGAYILNVVRVNSSEEEISNLRIHDHSYIRALEGVRMVKEKLHTDPSVSGEFGIMGSSLGGMLAAYVAGAEASFKASVIIVGAGNVPAVLANSDQELVVSQKNARQELFKLRTSADYEAFLSEAISLDPLDVIQNVAPGSTYFFIAKNDKTVPTVNQMELKNKAPSPWVYEMRGSHFEGIVKATTLHAGKILGFFKLKFSEIE